MDAHASGGGAGIPIDDAYSPRGSNNSSSRRLAGRPRLAAFNATFGFGHAGLRRAQGRG